MDIALRNVRAKDLETLVDNETFGFEEVVDWSEIPHEATPKGGSLPETRLKRKYQQLENLCKATVKIAKAGDVIVDFCSGGGHLGILIAYLLPRCTVILLENKEQSLKMAKERVKKLDLKNVQLFQCNLDYFKGNFDIGNCLNFYIFLTIFKMHRFMFRNVSARLRSSNRSGDTPVHQ